MSLPKTPAVTLFEHIDGKELSQLRVPRPVKFSWDDEVKTLHRCCGDEGKKMEASAESNRVAGGDVEAEEKMECRSDATGLLWLCARSPFENTRTRFFEPLEIAEIKRRRKLG
ncbi:hypothetical protein Q7P36_006492 [Cladosporium allicinum]